MNASRERRASCHKGIITVSYISYPSYSNSFQVRVYQAVKVWYQSLEDFREQRDNIRCHPDFHTRERRDCVILNTENHQFGRVEGLFRCTLPSSATYDVALVTTFKTSRWRPDTDWAGCTVVEPAGTMFISPQYFIRGALLVDTDLRYLTGRRFFVDDVFDNDMFLRMGN